MKTSRFVGILLAASSLLSAACQGGAVVISFQPTTSPASTTPSTPTPAPTGTPPAFGLASGDCDGAVTADARCELPGESAAALSDSK